jgi:DNA ligase-1
VVLDGEILCWRDEKPLPFALLQRRIGRLRVDARLRNEAPAAFMAYDVLEHRGRDVRELPIVQRRQILEALFEPLEDCPHARLSPLIDAASWDELTELRSAARQRMVEGLMLKRIDSTYAVGRPRGAWWKWKTDPYTIDAVLIYAQPGHGKRASLYTDYTFGLWHEGELAPVAKAYSGLTDAEIREVDAFVRRHTTDRFGPVRVVRPELVFELHFESIQPSTRHRSGVAVRFPRIHRWRRDKKPQDADTLDALKALAPRQPQSGRP